MGPGAFVVAFKETARGRGDQELSIYTEEQPLSYRTADVTAMPLIYCGRLLSVTWLTWPGWF